MWSKLLALLLALPLLAGSAAVAEDTSDILDFLPAFIKPAPNPPAFYWCQDLGDLGGGIASASAINNSGVVVGYATIAGTQRPHAFKWTVETGMVDLGTLSGGSAHANGVDDNGVVVGWSSTSDSISRPVGWNSAGPQDLGTMAGKAWNSGSANAVNVSGGIVGGCEVRNTTGANPYHAARWLPGSISDLDPAGVTNSEAFAVNAGGQVAGYFISSTGARHPFLWPAATGLKDLGTLGGASGMAFGINFFGQVVGEAQNEAGITRAFLWTQTEGMQELGFLGGYYKDSTARGINRHGWIVGNSDSNSGHHVAFLWVPRYGMVDLNLITFNIPEGDYLDIAFGINDAGQIVGQTARGRAFGLEPIY